MTSVYVKGGDVIYAGRREWPAIQWCHANTKTALKAWLGLSISQASKAETKLRTDKRW